MSKDPDSGRSSYLDFLVAVLSEHEKNMDRILAKMEMISQDLAKAAKLGGDSKGNRAVPKKSEISPEDQETLIYMKFRLSRSVNDLLKILQSLKE
jgi:hypothetical protein